MSQRPARKIADDFAVAVGAELVRASPAILMTDEEFRRFMDMTAKRVLLAREAMLHAVPSA